MIALASAWTCSAAGTARTWTGATDSGWNSAGNWAPSGAPAAADTLTLTNGNSRYPIISSGSAVGISITMGATGNGAAATLTVSGGALNLSGGLTLSGSSVITNTGGTIALAGGTFNTGTFFVQAGGSNSILGAVSLTGTFQQSGGVFVCNNTLTINSGGVLTNSGGLIWMAANTATALSDSIVVNGSLRQSGGTNATKDLNGTGTMAVSGGLLNISHDYKPTTPANFACSGGTIQFTASAGPGGFASPGTYRFFDVLIDNAVDPGFDSVANTIAIAGNLTNNGSPVFSASATTVVFNGNEDQNIAGANACAFSSLINSNTTGLVIARTNFTVASTCTLVNGSILQMGTQVMSGTGTFTNQAGSTLGIGSASGIASTGAFGNIQTTTRNFNPAAHYIYNGTTAQFTSNGLPATVTGNVTITNSAGVTLNRATTLTNLTLGVGKFTAVSPLLTMANGGLITRYTGWLSAAPTFGTTVGVSYQGITGVTNGPELPFSPTVLTNLTLNNSGDLILATNVTVTNGVLTLTSGDIVTGTYQVNLATNAVTAGASSNSYIRGNLQKAFGTGSGQSFTYPIGDTHFTPVGLAALNVTTAGTLLAKTTAGDHPGTTAATNGLNSAKSVNRYWTLTASGLVASACDPTFNFQSGDVDSAATTAKFVTRRYSDSAWAATPTGVRGPTSTGATNLTAFGDFAIGEQLINRYDVSATSPQTAGVGFNTTVTARDILNQTVPDDSATSVALTSSGSAQFDSDGNGMFGDTNKTLASGTFTISTKDTVAQTVTVTATDGNSKTGLSGNVVVTPAAASKLTVKTEPPASATAGVAFTTQPAVYVQDAFGNAVTNDSRMVTAALALGSGPLQGTITATASAGVATFTNLADNLAESIQLQYSAGLLAGITNATTIVVSPAPASQLVFTTAPVTNTAGAVSATLTVQRRDAFGNTNTADANRTVIVSSSSAGPVTFSPASPLILSNGFSSISFTYQDTKAGTPTITAASTSPSTITSATQVQQVNKATPTISGVTASQSIAYGTPTVTLSGAVSADGPLYPTNGEVVTVTINGLATNAAVAGGAGAFSVALPTATVPSGAFAVTYAYTGDANLYGATNSSTTLTINRGTPMAATLPVTSGIVYGQTLASSLVTGGVFTNLAGAAVAMAATNFVSPTLVPNVGVTNVLVTFTPVDTTNYTVATNTVSVTVGKAGLTQALTSSANPAAAGARVTFTLTLGAVAPGAGTPTGSVNFRIDGSVAGSGTLTAGIASCSTASLSHTTHTVVAEYAGDGNFLGTTNSLAPDQNINSAPVAGSDSLVRYATQGVKVRLATLQTNDSDDDSDALSVVVSSTSASNATVTVVSGWVFYTPAAGFTNADSFTYTIDDGHGGSATNTVAVGIQVDNDPGQNLTIVSLDNNSVLIQGSGIPGRTYRMQSTESLSPVNWQDLTGGALTADSNGRFQYTDSSVSSQRYYRTVYP